MKSDTFTVSGCEVIRDIVGSHIGLAIRISYASVAMDGKAVIHAKEMLELTAQSIGCKVIGYGSMDTDFRMATLWATLEPTEDVWES